MTGPFCVRLIRGDGRSAAQLTIAAVAVRSEARTRDCAATKGELRIRGRRNRRAQECEQCDPDSDGRLPVLVIDGKAFTWEQVGRMLKLSKISSS